jgi:hypothetical protein
MSTTGSTPDALSESVVFPLPIVAADSVVLVYRTPWHLEMRKLDLHQLTSIEMVWRVFGKGGGANL